MRAPAGQGYLGDLHDAKVSSHACAGPSPTAVLGARSALLSHLLLSSPLGQGVPEASLPQEAGRSAGRPPPAPRVAGIASCRGRGGGVLMFVQ